MINKRFIKLSAFSTIFVLSIIIYVVVYNTYQKKNTPAYQFLKFKEEYSEQKSKLINTISKIESKEDIHSESNLKNNFSGIVLLEYADDSLIFWNAITVSIPESSILKDTGYNVHKLPTGYYQVFVKHADDVTIAGLQLIKHEYPYTNQFLPESFNDNYTINKHLTLNLSEGDYQIKIKENKYLSLHFPKNISLSNKQEYILFSLFFLIFILSLAILTSLYIFLSNYIKNKAILVILFAADVIIIRLILYFFKIPGILYTLELFSPTNFSCCFLFTSAGDLLLNAIAIFSIIYFARKYLPEKPKNLSKNIFRTAFKVFSIFLHFFIFSNLLIILQKAIIKDSTHSLDLGNFFYLDLYSYILLLSFALIVLSYALITIKLFNYSFSYFYHNKKLYLFCLTLSIILASVYFSIFHSIYSILIPSGILILYLIFKLYNNELSNYYHIIIYLILYSSIFAISFNNLNHQKITEEKKLLAISMHQNSNPASEYKLSENYHDVLKDSIIDVFLIKSYSDLSYDDSIQEYIHEKYISPIFPGYSSYTTICQEDRLLNIQPDNVIVPCEKYFEDLKYMYADTTEFEHIYTVKNYESSQYLIEYPFIINKNELIDTLFLYTELLYNNAADAGLGYPELLIDTRVESFLNTGKYSYARYFNNSLVYNVGSFDFNTSLISYNIPGKCAYFSYNNYDHYIYTHNNYSVIVSTKTPGLIEKLSTFSFLFILFLATLILFFIIFELARKKSILYLNFRNKLQFSIAVIILSIFILLGTISVSYIIDLYQQKNADILEEKTQSVLIELEHKLSDEPDIGPEQSQYISQLLEKFSLVFFSDINLYDLDGKLISTSRPQVFDMSLISNLINPDAFQQLSKDNELLFIHKEKIGTYEYLSAYVPFRNIDNKIVAYLNLPYFAKQTELQHEISIVLTTFINIYIFFVALAILISVVISRYTTRPLKLLKDKLANLSINKTNEKIEWKGRDEIGKLVSEYNRMIDELSVNAELLAQSERETAWREMAKQVAHEIKNPLTPMKLSVQYLEKAWKENSPDWEQRLQRFTQTIIEQIDSLSAIATEFSDFAKMPDTKLEEIDISKIIANSTQLFRDYSDISISFSYDKSRDYHITADGKQLLRVFNNLLQNAVQALSDTSSGKINMSLYKEKDYYKISISDNGAGIPEEQAHKIFSPSFTTKSSGMGLGLAIVKSIIISYGGSIKFESEVDKGTTFYVVLPT